MTKGIVIVSHVEEIGLGLHKLLQEVAKDVPITVAAGTEDGGIGTSFDKVMAAFSENTADELIAFYDLGSSKMNLEMAIEMHEKEVKMYDASFIEGAYVTAAMLQVDTPIEAIESELNKLKVK